MRTPYGRSLSRWPPSSASSPAVAALQRSAPAGRSFRRGRAGSRARHSARLDESRDRVRNPSPHLSPVAVRRRGMRRRADDDRLHVARRAPHAATGLEAEARRRVQAATGADDEEIPAWREPAPFLEGCQRVTRRFFLVARVLLENDRATRRRRRAVRRVSRRVRKSRSTKPLRRLGRRRFGSMHSMRRSVPSYDADARPSVRRRRNQLVLGGPTSQ
jgi:hypothetical protein